MKHTDNTAVEKKPVVTMYYSYGDRIGGPLTYINTIINSDLQSKYEFTTCYQNKAPGGVDIPLLKAMVKELRRIKPDIVHIQGAQSEGFYGVLAAKILKYRKDIKSNIGELVFVAVMCVVSVLTLVGTLI